MSRCLIVCIDGTWSSSAEKSRYFFYPTSVERISQLLVNDSKRQQIDYLPGVGTGGLVDRVIGGIWGAGSNERIRSGYRFLCENYREGVRLAFFGFNRGAFTVRAIIGLSPESAFCAPISLSMFLRQFPFNPFPQAPQSSRLEGGGKGGRASGHGCR
jgi:uncharacterized protein (DUF2235 family)